MKFLLDFLEKGSAWLDKISKPMETKMAYFFCMAQIIVCLIAIAIALVFFVYSFAGQTDFNIRMLLVLVFAVLLFVLGGYAYMLITRDLKHIKERGQKKNPFDH